ncbi:Translin [Trichoderma citrinoviride]|uniref:Translin n=1 Tax=Trichoderma citrinoviride TaxID=58853 RepID=A0A2T4BGT8_9HYPO|nr:Translin [Trichoderma citrinoviride]PTB68533.1 Translin [Trichoderma citrinoviride]
MAAPPPTLLDPSIFASLEAKLEEETQIRDTLSQLVQRLERSVATAQGLLSRVHSTPRSRYPQLVAQVESAVKDEAAIISELDKVASQHPYYKYNYKWTRSVQHAIGTAIYCAWLGGFPPKAPEPEEAPSSEAAPSSASSSSKEAEIGRLLTLEEVGAIFSVPTNLKSRDAFHLTIEEYLLSLVDLTSDLSRLATNAVTLGDFQLPLAISAFVKDLFAGFQLLNLKNDIIRKRADGVKYEVKRVEDVVYDLSLRGLIQRPTGAEGDTEMEAAQ